MNNEVLVLGIVRGLAAALVEAMKRSDDPGELVGSLALALGCRPIHLHQVLGLAKIDAAMLATFPELSYRHWLAAMPVIEGMADHRDWVFDFLLAIRAGGWTISEVSREAYRRLERHNGC
jgi:hypothetical protein